MDCISSRIYSGFIREYLLGKLNYLNNSDKIILCVI